MKISFSEIKPFVRFARYMKLNNNYSFPSRFPYDARLFYVLSGEGIIEINDTIRKMPANSLMIINSGTEYRLAASEKGVEYIAVNFDYTFINSNRNEPVAPDIFTDYDSHKLIGHVEFYDIPEFDFAVYLENIKTAEKALIKIENEYSRKVIMHELKCSALMTDVLTKCFRYIKTKTVFDSSSDTADRILNYIQENFNKDLTNKALGDIFNYHPNYISNMIKKYTGMPLHHYLISIRIAKAADMLSNGNKTIGEISGLCGFYDICHFSKYFKKIMGLTPTEYINRYN